MNGGWNGFNRTLIKNSAEFHRTETGYLSRQAEQNYQA